MEPREEISVALDGEFVISLPANATGGYLWSIIDVSPGDVVSPVDWVFQTRETQPGAGTLQVFRFVASRPGRATIRFQYARPWEENSEPKLSANYVVVVPEG